jgi:hypothetical protein
MSERNSNSCTINSLPMLVECCFPGRIPPPSRTWLRSHPRIPIMWRWTRLMRRMIYSCLLLTQGVVVRKAFVYQAFVYQAVLAWTGVQVPSCLVARRACVVAEEGCSRPSKRKHRRSRSSNSVLLLCYCIYCRTTSNIAPVYVFCCNIYGVPIKTSFV